jgi:hypothetical protein
MAIPLLLLIQNLSHRSSNFRLNISTDSRIKKYHKMGKFVDPVQYYKSLDENTVLGLFPRHVERYGVLDLVQCEFKKSMRYEEV